MFDKMETLREKIEKGHRAPNYGGDRDRPRTT